MRKSTTGPGRRVLHLTYALNLSLMLLLSSPLVILADDGVIPSLTSKCRKAVASCSKKALESMLDCRRDLRDKPSRKRSLIEKTRRNEEATTTSAEEREVHLEREHAAAAAGSVTTSWCRTDSETSVNLSQCLEQAEECTIFIPSSAIFDEIIAPASNQDLLEPPQNSRKRCRKDSRRMRSSLWKCSTKKETKIEECNHAASQKFRDKFIRKKRCDGTVLAADRMLFAVEDVVDSVYTYLSLLDSLKPWTGRVQFVEGVSWASWRELTESSFHEKLDSYVRSGRMMVIDVDVVRTSNGMRYSMVLQKNVDRRVWKCHVDLTSDGYHEIWDQYREEGYRPLDVEGYAAEGNRILYAGIWIENREDLSWSSKRNMNSEEYSDYFEEQREAGRRVINLESYDNQFAAIWWENKPRIGWIQLRNMDRETYQEEVDQQSEDGYILVDYESYKLSGKTRYAAIWEKNVQNVAYVVRTNRDEIGYANYWRQYRDEGYRIVDFENYDGGAQYGGIWIRNVDRHPKSNEIDNLIQEHQDASNIPGVSVAVISYGKEVYRRGFGLSDVAANKAAHSETIYGCASVSKTFGGTLAASLYTDGPRDGTSISFDLGADTTEYLGDGPSWNLNPGARSHSHTPRELSAHLSCVPHYSGTTPSVPNVVTHYTDQTDAARDYVWPRGLMTDTNTTEPGAQWCTVGTTVDYSTAAFTLLGAVLEEVTGRDVHSLLRSEITDPLRLYSTRAQFEGTGLVPSYERAVPYDDPSTPTSYSDNSWKVIGGGMESTAIELARFADRLRGGRLTSVEARDEMWTQTLPSTYGVGWRVSSRVHDGVSMRVALHSGSWTGARSHLRVYPDHGLSIAVMSNMREDDWSPSALADDIVECIFNN